MDIRLTVLRKSGSQARYAGECWVFCAEELPVWDCSEPPESAWAENACVLLNRRGPGSGAILDTFKIQVEAHLQEEEPKGEILCCLKQ